MIPTTGTSLHPSALAPRRPLACLRDLPDELKLEVAKRLDPRDLARLAQVDRNFYGVCNDDAAHHRYLPPARFVATQPPQQARATTFRAWLAGMNEAERSFVRSTYFDDHAIDLAWALKPARAPTYDLAWVCAWRDPCSLLEAQAANLYDTELFRMALARDADLLDHRLSAYPFGSDADRKDLALAKLAVTSNPWALGKLEPELRDNAELLDLACAGIRRLRVEKNWGYFSSRANVPLRRELRIAEEVLAQSSTFYFLLAPALQTVPKVASLFAARLRDEEAAKNA